MSLTTSNEDVDKNLGDLLHILARVVSEIFEKASLAEVSPQQLSQPQLNMLTLLDAAGVHSMTELCRIHNITPPAATKNIDKLENLGLVRRLLTNGDRRLVRVEVTPAGSRLVQAYRQTYLHKVPQALAGFSIDDKKSLSEAIEDFIRNGIAAKPESALICLQCQGRFSDSCVLQDHFDRCLYARSD